MHKSNTKEKKNIQQKGFVLVCAILLMSCNSKSKPDAIVIDDLETTESDIITITKSQFDSSNMELGVVSFSL